MDITFISPGVLPLPPVDGGAVENLIQMFIDENELTGNHNIRVISIYSSKAKEKSKDFKYCKYKYVKLDSIFSKIFIVIRHMINKYSSIYIGNEYITQALKYFYKDIYKSDVVVIENKPELGLIIKKSFKGKIILHLHNDWLNYDTKNSECILKEYDSIFAISNFINKSVASIEESTKIETLYNGVDLERFNLSKYKSRNILRGKYGIKEDEIVILYSGRIVKEKGIKELLEAFSLLKNNNKAKLVIVGSQFYNKPSKDKFTNEINELAQSIKGSIIFTGYIDYNKMPEIYSMADIGIVPSIWEEPFALTVVEFMAMGIPLIVSNSGGIPELIDENSAIVVNKDENYIEGLKESINILLNNSELRQNMSEYAVLKAEKFSKKVYYTKFNTLLDKYKNT